MLNRTATNQAKGLAILAVVLIHLIAVFPAIIYTEFAWSPAVVILQLILRFCVPLFIALSGYGLSLKYQASSSAKNLVNFPWREFLIRRFGKLLPLYLLWSVVHLTSFYLYPSWRIMPEYPLWQTLLLGLADYQLYFVPLIFQLYLLFPLLTTLAKPQLRWLIIIFFLVQLTLAVFLTQLTLGNLLPDWPIWITSDQWQYRLVLHWLGYFSLGMWLAFLKPEPSKRWLSPLLISLTTLGLIWAYLNTTNLLQTTSNVVFATSFLHLPIIIMVAGMIGLIFLHGEKIMSKIPLLGQRWLASLGRHSYFIFLSHTLALRLLFSLFLPGPSWEVWGVAAGLFVLSSWISLRVLK